MAKNKAKIIENISVTLRKVNTDEEPGNIVRTPSITITILAKPEYPNGLIIELCTLIIISKTEGFSPKS